MPYCHHKLSRKVFNNIFQAVESMAIPKLSLLKGIDIGKALPAGVLNKNVHNKE